MVMCGIMRYMLLCAFRRDQSRSNSANISLDYYNFSTEIAPFYVLSNANFLKAMAKHTEIRLVQPRNRT